MRELGRGSIRAGLELIDFFKFKRLHKILHGTLDGNPIAKSEFF